VIVRVSQKSRVGYQEGREALVPIVAVVRSVGSWHPIRGRYSNGRNAAGSSKGSGHSAHEGTILSVADQRDEITPIWEQAAKKVVGPDLALCEIADHLEADHA